VGTNELVPCVQGFVDDDDQMLGETAAWALGRIAERTA
jgi:hypothetical protein